MQLIELKVKKQLLTEELQKRRAEMGDQNINYFDKYFDHTENTVESLTSAMEKKKKYIDLYNKIKALVSELNDIDYCIAFYNAFIRLYDGSNECKINYTDCSGIQSQSARKLICDSFALSKLNVVFEKNIYINDSYAIVRAEVSSVEKSPVEISPVEKPSVEKPSVEKLPVDKSNSTNENKKKCIFEYNNEIEDALKVFKKLGSSVFVQINIDDARLPLIKIYLDNTPYEWEIILTKEKQDAIKTLNSANINVEYIYYLNDKQTSVYFNANKL